MELSKINETLMKYNQMGLVKFYDSLSDEEKYNLIQDIKKIDFDLMEKLFNLAKNFKTDNTSSIEVLDNIYLKEKINNETYSRWEKIGTDVIQKGEFAVLTMAGGQGTRLGFNGPKGTYMLNVFGGPKSIFEILIDKLKAVKLKYGVTLHWYIMTSEENNQDTINFFEANDYFKYGKENITFFKQGVLPMLDVDGNVILDTKSQVKFAADGNGGVFSAIAHNILEDIKMRNIKWLYISGVDNILVNYADEVFLGGTIDTGKLIGSKSILKEYAEEKVGVICKKNGKPGVIEYTEIPENLLNEKKEDGELLLCESNIVSNIYSVELLEKIGEKNLPYHVAFKKCDVLDNNGEKISVDTPNAYKFETFIFDSYEYTDDIFILRVKREDEFAPIKNKEGLDSPETAIFAYNKKQTQSQ